MHMGWLRLEIYLPVREHNFISEIYLPVREHTWLIGSRGIRILYTNYAYGGVATVSRIDKIIGLFCRILSLLQGFFAKVTNNFIDPTDQSHPISQRYMDWCYGVALVSRID